MMQPSPKGRERRCGESRRKRRRKRECGESTRTARKDLADDRNRIKDKTHTAQGKNSAKNDEWSEKTMDKQCKDIQMPKDMDEVRAMIACLGQKVKDEGTLCRVWKILERQYAKEI